MNTQTAVTHPAQLTEQPIHWWPRLYFLPRTHYVQRQRAANSPQYNPRPKAEMFDYEATSTEPPHENWLQAMLRRELEMFQEACADAWTGLKQAGRSVVRWLAWKVMFPLSIACAIWIPAVSPMKLPL